MAGFKAGNEATTLGDRVPLELPFKVATRGHVSDEVTITYEW